MPAARQARRSSSKASAVRATIGVVTPRAAQRPGRREAVHAGHAQVHQDQVVVWPMLPRRSGLAAADGAVHGAALALQQGAGQEGVDRIVLGQQHPRADRRWRASRPGVGALRPTRRASPRPARPAPARPARRAAGA